MFFSQPVSSHHISFSYMTTGHVWNFELFVEKEMQSDLKLEWLAWLYGTPQHVIPSQDIDLCKVIDTFTPVQ